MKRDAVSVSTLNTRVDRFANSLTFVLYTTYTYSDPTWGLTSAGKQVSL